MDEKYLRDKMPNDFIDGALFIIEDYFQFVESSQSNFKMTELKYFNEVMNYYHLLNAYLSKHKYNFNEIDIDPKRPDLLSGIEELFVSEKANFELKHKERSISNSSQKYDSIFESTFLYEFSVGDLKRIQELINLLRKDISESDVFSSDHQRRLLKRLEKLQSELHKEMSDLDRFWGLIGDAGVVIGKFGNDVKPMVDRIREIAGIVWKTQSKSEGLPDGSKIPFIDDENEGYE